MKTSHLTTPRSMSECIFDPAGDAFDWTRQQRSVKPALIWIAGILGLAMLTLALAR